MSEPKKTNHEQKISKKGIYVLIIILVVLLAAVILILTPFGKKLLSPVLGTTAAGTTEASESVTTASTSAESAAPSTTGTGAKGEYSITVDETAFSSAQKGDVMTITAKKNKAVQMTITTLKNKSYDAQCEELKKSYAPMGDTGRLNISNKNAGFRIQSGDENNDTITTVYCVDNGAKGCVVIKYTTTVAASKGFGAQLQKMLSTFCMNTK